MVPGYNSKPAILSDPESVSVKELRKSMDRVRPENPLAYIRALQQSQAGQGTESFDTALRAIGRHVRKVPRCFRTGAAPRNQGQTQLVGIVGFAGQQMSLTVCAAVIEVCFDRKTRIFRMAWEPSAYEDYQWIVADAKLLGGKLAIRGTRLSVALILDLLANGMSLDEIDARRGHNA